MNLDFRHRLLYQLEYWQTENKVTQFVITDY
jgi:hypothetical protein